MNLQNFRQKIKKYNTIKLKIALIVLISTGTTIALFIYYSSYSNEQRLKKQLKSDLQQQGKITALIVEKQMQQVTSSLTSLSKIISTNTYNFTDNELKLLLKEYLNSKAEINSIGIILEPVFWSKDTNYRQYADKHYNIHYLKDEYNEIKTKEIETFEIENLQWYFQAKEKNDFHFIEDDKTYFGKYLSTIKITYPIIKNSYFSGLIYINYNFNTIQKKVDEFFIDSNSDIKYVIVSNAGKILAANYYTDSIGKNADFLINNYKEHIENPGLKNNLIEKDNKLCGFTFIDNQSTQKWLSYIFYQPETYQKFFRELKNTTFRELIFADIITILLIIAIILYVRYLLRPLTIISEELENVAKGKLSYKNIKTKSAEIEKINKAFQQVFVTLNQKTEIVKAIAQGDLSKKITIKSQDDELGKSLNQMVSTLKRAKTEQEKREKEDSVRNWTTNGLAKFADILRQNNHDIHILSKNIIRNLINYLEANLGGIFIINHDHDNTPYISLSAAYAYDRYRKSKKRYDIDEGLIGRCIYEKRTIFMEKIPETYIEIKSGLGNAQPACLLLVPLKVNNEIYGVVELASFKQMQQHQIEFANKIAENIASTISSVKVNMETKRLLKESQEQSEKLAQQEEEVRQNLEEMQATQEEAARKELELRGIFDAVNKSKLYAEFDQNGLLLKSNQLFDIKMEYAETELSGLMHSQLIPKKNNEEQEKVKKIWKNLLAGEAQTGIFKRINKNQKELILTGIYEPIFTDAGTIKKIILLATDISDFLNNKVKLI